MRSWYFVLLLLAMDVTAQPVKEKLALAVQQMEATVELRHAIVGICVVDSKTGALVYAHNAEIGLAPASTQKIFTSCAAFDLLGKDYRYTTEIGFNSSRLNDAQGGFVIKGSGDPSFGSSRFASTQPARILDSIVAALQRKRIQPVAAFQELDDHFSLNVIPGGWIWEDIGNYYGAAPHAFNWQENQYDIVLKSGKTLNEPVDIVRTQPGEAGKQLLSAVSSAEKGSGDNTIVYLPNGDIPALISGSIPVNENAFVVGAVIPNPLDVFTDQLTASIKSKGIQIKAAYQGTADSLAVADTSINYSTLYKHASPPLDSLNYWFLKKSINLYGEALLKTMSLQKNGYASTEKGVDLMKDFWSGHGIEKSALHICDGSGLSPQNRVTADALVKALQYARTRDWFPSFYYDLPQYNGMKMKSGSISAVKAYAGYQEAKDGKAYVFAIIINNFDGAASVVVQKMYKVLDNLK